MRDVIANQIPLLDGQRPDLVTCGAGANDILYSAPGKLFSDLRTLLAAVPEDTVMLDLPLLNGFWGIVGHMSVPYITRINRVIREVATERSLRVAEVSKHFIPPWVGKFSVDNFHPSQDGYRDWSRALVQTLSAGTAAVAALRPKPQTAANRRQPGTSPRPYCCPAPACITPIVSSLTEFDVHPVDLKGRSTACVSFGG